MTIHKHKTGHYVLLADVAPLERALLMAWLVGMPQPPVEDAVYLADYLRFLKDRRGLHPEEEVC